MFVFQLYLDHFLTYLLSGYQKNSGGLEWNFATHGGPHANHDHQLAKLASYQGAPFVAGGLWHGKTEVLEWSKDISKPMKWKMTTEFPNELRKGIYRYSAVSTSTAVFITCNNILNKNGYENGVVKFENDKWSYVGALKYGPRHYHGSILIKGKI